MLFWRELSEAVKQYAPRFAYLRRYAPIDTPESVFEFARTRAAFVCQKKLYGYVKARIGTRFPKLMNDDIFVRSLNIAKLEIYAACLADMTCFCLAETLNDPGIDNAFKAEQARACYALGIAENDDGSCGPDAAARWRAGFDDRMAKTVWHTNGRAHFTESPKALLRWAPIADELKALDAEIVENSIANAWIEFRQEFTDRLDAAAARTSFAARIAGIPA